MIGTTLTRESSAGLRPKPSRPAAPPPVLIEVPTLPGTRPHRLRSSPHRRPIGARPRRRLRREVRWLGSAAIVGAAAVAGVLAVRAPRSAFEGAPPGDGPAQADPFAIELDHPIPVPAEPIAERAASRIEALPVAFPGYLLPGDGVEVGEVGPDPASGDGEGGGEGEEERGHARP